MPEIFYILQMRIEKAHQFDDGIGIALALFLILERQQIFDHFLDMTTILTHHQMVPRSIIFHVLYTGQVGTI